MANGIKTGDTRGFNKGHSSKFHEGSRFRQTPKEGRRTYRPKRCGKNNKDEDNSPKTLNDKDVKLSLTGFLFLDLFSYQGWRTESTLLFTESWCGGGNSWMHTFPKSVSATLNPNSLVQNLNSFRRVHFLRWRQSHHKHLNKHLFILSKQI